MRSVTSCCLISLFIVLFLFPEPALAHWPSQYANPTNHNFTAAEASLPFSLDFTAPSRYTTPVIEQNILVTGRLSGTTRYITAYDATTGTHKWDISLGSYSPRQAIVYEGRVYFGTGIESALYAVDLLTGNLLWKRIITQERNIRHAPVVAGGALFIAGDKLHKISLAGDYLWNQPYDIVSPLAVHNNDLYFRVHQQGLIRFDTQTDIVLWRYNTNTTLGTHPLVTDDTVYVGLYQRFVALDRLTGLERWNYHLPSTRPFIEALTVSGLHSIISTSSGDLIRFDQNGVVVWRKQFNTGDYQGNGWSTPLVATGNMLIGRYNQLDTLMLNPADGSFIWKEPLSTTGLTPVAISSPHIYFTKDNQLYAYRAEQWTTPAPPTPTPEDTSPRPIIVVPGILESWQVFGTWHIDPIFGIFRKLFTALSGAGYIENDTLIPFPYDWHQPNEQTAQQLQEKIRQTKERTGVSEVDIIAHSMGGLVARSYIQSDNYAHDVRKLITIATPHHGSAKAYPIWEAAEAGSSLIDTVTEKLIAYEARRAGYAANVVAYIQERVPTVGQLLPIHDYLTDGVTTRPYLPCFVINYPCNPFLESLANNTAKLLVRTKHSNIVAEDEETKTIRGFRVMDSLLANIWPHGLPLNYPTDTGFLFDKGDNTVTVASAELPGAKEVKITANHTSAVTQAIPTILQELTGQHQTSSNQFQLPSRVLFLEFTNITRFQVLDSKQRLLNFSATKTSLDTEAQLYLLQDGLNGIAVIPNPSASYTITAETHSNAIISASLITEIETKEDTILLSQLSDSIKLDTDSPTDQLFQEEILVSSSPPASPLQSSINSLASPSPAAIPPHTATPQPAPIGPTVNPIISPTPSLQPTPINSTAIPSHTNVTLSPVALASPKSLVKGARTQETFGHRSRRFYTFILIITIGALLLLIASYRYAQRE